MFNLVYFMHSLPYFAAYFSLSVALVGIFIIIYTYITPFDEFKLIKEGNIAPAISFVGALLGFALPLASVAANSESLVDLALWGLVALIVQIVVFLSLVLFLKDLSNRISQHNEIPSAIVSAGFSITFGLISAACLVP